MDASASSTPPRPPRRAGDNALSESNAVDPNLPCLCVCWTCTERGHYPQGRRRTVRTWRLHRRTDELLLEAILRNPLTPPDPLLVATVEFSELILLQPEERNPSPSRRRSRRTTARAAETPSPVRRSPSVAFDYGPQGASPSPPSPSPSVSPSVSSHQPASPSSSTGNARLQALRRRALQGLDETHVGAELLADHLLDWVDIPLPDEEPANSLRALTLIEKRTLRQYRRWLQTRQTVAAWRANACTFREEKIPVHTLRRAERLAQRVTGLAPVRLDMCVNSCVAFVGKYRWHNHCPFVRTVEGEQVLCGQRRYKKPRFAGDTKLRPRRTYLYIPILDRLRAMYLNPHMSKLLGYRHSCLERLRETSSSRAWSSHVFKDAPDGLLHLQLADEKDLFPDARDVALVLSTDGAQLAPSTKGCAWFISASMLNIPPHLRFKRAYQHILAVVPGPQQPGDIDSFFHPFREEMARLAKGEPVWDGSKTEWFRLRAYVVAASADQPGSSKINKMKGVQGYRGCRFCMMCGCSKRNSSADPLVTTNYFPLRTPRPLRQAPANASRPHRYHPYRLPLRTHDMYCDHIASLAHLDRHGTVRERRLKAKEIGVQSLTDLAFSPAFVHPWFFPLDAFHLFSYNTFETIWDVVEQRASANDPDVFTARERRRLGRLVESARVDLPGDFGKAPRNPDTKANSHFKMVEWISIFHYYLGPFLHSLGSDRRFLVMLLYLLDGVAATMQDCGLVEADIRMVRKTMAHFCRAWEDLYIGDDAKMLGRARMSIHLLLHVAEAIPHIGNMRSASQGACERLIGSTKSDLRSHKDRYAAIVRRTLMVEQGHVLDFVLNDDIPRPPSDTPNGLRIGKAAPLQRLRLRQVLVTQIVSFLAGSGIEAGAPNVSFHRVIRVTRDGRTFLVRSRAGTYEGTSRLSSRVAALHPDATSAAFFEVLAFIYADDRLLAVAHPFRISRSDLAVTRHWVGGSWSSALELVDATTILDLMGQFTPTPNHTYLFPRKTSVGGFASWWTRNWDVLSACEQWPIDL